MPDIRGIEDPRFWSQFDRELYSNTARVLLSIFLAGGKVGASQLPQRVQVLLNWDVFNRAASDYLNLYRLNTVPNISNTARKVTIKTIQDWIESGEKLDMLIDRLTPLFGASRAERIAVTEVTRTYASGNIAAWKSTGLVTRKVWRTANDELVCPVCGPLNGKTVSIDGNFMLDLNELPQELAQQMGEEFIFYQPPAHPRCRCWISPEVTEVALRRKIREALYE